VSCHDEGRCGRHAHARTQMHTQHAHTNKYTRNTVCGSAVCAVCRSSHKQVQTKRTHTQTYTHATQSAGALSECSIRNDNNKRLISENGTDSQKLCLYWQI
jgi:hypothetical protein